MANRTYRIPKPLKKLIRKVYRPVRPTSEFLTIEEICKLLNTPVPRKLASCRKKPIGGVETRRSQIRENDVFFDVQDDDIASLDAELAKCLLVVTSRTPDSFSTLTPVLVVENPMEGYLKVCSRMIDLNSKVVRVGVGGSLGKTSMKEMIASVLQPQMPVCRSFANSNNIFGLAKQIGRIQPKHKCYVQEVGLMSDGRGWLTEAMGHTLKPHIAVITNISDNHSEAYGDREGIYKYKIALADAVMEDGLILLNKDDSLLAGYSSERKVLYYSVDDQKADIFATNIESRDDGLHFDINYLDEVIPNVHLKMFGKHNIYNVLAAFAVAKHLGLSNNVIVESIAKYKQNDGTRQNYIKVSGFNLLLDCFNASPDSVKHALNAMADVKLPAGANKIAVLGDIAELGERTEYLHEELGSSITPNQVDILFCFGPLSRYIYEAAKKNGIEAHHTTERVYLEELLRNEIKPGDLVLWKASHSGHLELSVDNLFGTDYYTLYPAENAGEGTEIVKGKTTFKLYSNGAKITACDEADKRIELPANINGMQIRTIGKSVFRKKNIDAISIPDGLVNIGKYAFYKSTLKSVVIPRTVEFCGEEAFCGCTSLQTVELHCSGHIGANAFNGCRALTDVFVFGDPYAIDNAFDFCPNATIHCHRDSKIAKVASSRPLKVKYMD